MVLARSIFAFIFMLALLGATGCGGDDDESASIEKADFVTQTNAICKKGKKELLREIVAYQQKNLNESSPQVTSGAARSVIKPKLEAQIERIRSVGEPSEGAEEVEQFYSSLLEGVDEIAEEKPPTFNEAESMLVDASEIARRYGIDECEYILVDEEFAKRVLKSG